MINIYVQFLNFNFHILVRVDLKLNYFIELIFRYLFSEDEIFGIDISGIHHIQPLSVLIVIIKLAIALIENTDVRYPISALIDDLSIHRIYFDTLVIELPLISISIFLCTSRLFTQSGFIFSILEFFSSKEILCNGEPLSGFRRILVCQKNHFAP